MSFFKTWAAKHQSSVKNILRGLLNGKDYVYRDEAKGKQRQMKVVALKDRKKPSNGGLIDHVPTTAAFSLGRNELLRRLSAEVCEYCGKTDGCLEGHHVRKLSDIKDGKEPWERTMIAMQRKTIILCVECHDLLTHGKLPSWKRKGMKVESRVR